MQVALFNIRRYRFLYIDHKAVKLSNREVEKTLGERLVVEIGVVTAQKKQFQKLLYAFFCAATFNPAGLFHFSA
jgi:hypothetical protein